MKTSEVYFKTMKFVWLKLALGGATLLFSLITLAIFLGLGSLFKDGGIVIFFWLWVLLVCGVYYWVNHYIGYMIKAGHVAMVSTAVTTGSLPDNQLETAKNMVKQRFATANVYFVVDNLVSGAVSQLQKGLQGIDNLLGNIPGVSNVISFAKAFIGIALGYVDECCLGYTFLHKDQSAYKSAADGVVIYFQNWKSLIKDALIATVIVMVSTFFAWVIPFALFAVIFGALGVHWVFAAIVGIICGVTIKSAFIDSYMMVKMMVTYMQVAPTTEITFDLYGKLCNLSAKFKKLFDKGQEDQTMQPVQPVQQSAQVQ